jgi:hypothetical protein
MRTIAFVTSVVLTGWIAASAQQTPPPSNEPAHKIYAMSGCLELGSGSSSAFKLTGAEPIGQAPPGASATATSRNATVYELQPVANFGEQGISRERLKSHVGKRVEVTVRPVEVSPSPTSPPRTTDGPEKPEQPLPPRYTVVTINQLAESCQ